MNDNHDFRNHVADVIEDCKKEGILEDYLSRNADRVTEMLTQQYEIEAYTRVVQEEAAEEKALDIAVKLHKMGIPDEIILEITGADDWRFMKSIKEK